MGKSLKCILGDAQKNDDVVENRLRLYSLNGNMNSIFIKIAFLEQYHKLDPLLGGLIIHVYGC